MTNKPVVQWKKPEGLKESQDAPPSRSHSLDTNLDTNLGTAMKRITRKPEVAKLLIRLHQQDRLYNYHLPPAILENYPDETLLSYLEREYSSEFFVLSAPDEVARYAQIADRVIKRGDFRVLAWQVPYQMQGTIKEMTKQKDTVKVKFPRIKEAIPVPLKDLYGIGDRLFFSMIERIDYWHSLYPGDKIIKPGTVVEYRGKGIESYNIAIPDETQGIIMGFREFGDGKRMAIAWANAPGVKHPIEAIYGNTTYSNKVFLGFYPPMYFKEDDIRLVIPNTLHFPSLLEECLQTPLTSQEKYLRQEKDIKKEFIIEEDKHDT